MLKRAPSLQHGAITVGTEWQFLKQLNIDLPDDPAIPLLGI